MRRLIAKTEGGNQLGLREVLQRFADDQRSAQDLSDNQRAEILLDQFKRHVASELQLLELRVD